MHAAPRAAPPPAEGAAAAALPASVPLGGTDWMLAMSDTWMRWGGGPGAVCHLLLDLGGPVADLEARLAAEPVWAWTRALRLRGRPPLSLPRWEVDAFAPTAEVPDHGAWPDEITLVASLPSRIDLRREPGVAIGRARMGERDLIVLSWHHALFDARGAERLIRRLGGDPQPDPPAMEPPQPLVKRLTLARRARDHIFRASVGGLRWLPRRDGPRHDGLRRLRLEGDELEAYDARAAALGAEVLRGAFHVAAVSAALAGQLAARGAPDADLLVALPQDRRRGAIRVGNQVGVLFLRVPTALREDPRRLITHVAEQIRGIVRDQIPAALASLLDLCRWLPAWFYGLVVRLPTAGELATLGVSDTGDSLQHLRRLFERDVVDARHVPANLHPPGLTVVFTRHRGALDVVVRWREDRLSAAEIADLIGRITGQLTGR